MILKHQFFSVLLITFLLYVENSEAGWNFWQRATTTTTTPFPLQYNNYPQSITTPTKVGGPIVTATNTATSSVSQGPAIGMDGAQQNVRPNRPNPGTEVGQDIIVPRPNRPGIGGGNGQTYQNWAANFAGVEPVQNQPSRTPGLATNGDSQMRPNLPTDFGPQPSNIPFQPTQPSVAGSRNTPVPDPYAVNILTPRPPKPTFIGPVKPVPPVRVDQNNPNSPSNGQTWANGGTRGSGSPTGLPRQPEYPGSPVRVDQNNPNNPSNGQTWANVAGGTRGSGSPTGLPRQPEYPGENGREVTPGTPTRPGQFPNQPNRPTSPGVAVGPAAGAATGAPVVYSSNPTYSKGNTVTNEDLEKLSEALYIKDRSNTNQYVTVNLQSQTTSSNPTDQAPQPLLTVNPEAFQISTIQKVLSIFDNYHLDTLTREHINPAQREEESRLVDTFLSTDVMSAAMRFLANKGFVRQDYYEYKALLRKIWFDLFSRGQGKIGSTGFEHVFMAETKQEDSGTDVLGLHNWIFFNAEERKNHVDYLGYIKKIDLGNKGSIVKMHAKFNGYDKPVVTVFIGTSPELEMALYTVCFYARPDGNCPVSLGGTKFNIITRKFKYRGKDLIGTAYPDI